MSTDVDATLTWGGLGCGGVRWGCLRSFNILQPRSFDLAQDVYKSTDVDATLTWGGVGCGGVRWGCLRSFNRVPSTLHKMSTDVDATLTWGGVGCGGVRWGAVGCGGDVYVPSTAFLRPCTRCLQMLMLRSHGVGWGDRVVRVSHHVPHCMLLLLLMMMIPSNSSKRGAFFVALDRKHTVVTCHSVLFTSAKAMLSEITTDLCDRIL